MTRLAIRLAQPPEYPHVREAYARWGYGGDVAAEDVVYVAEHAGRLIGAVRRTTEHGVVLLRGLYVDPTYQRRGVGTALLRAFVDGLCGTACYCVPRRHLEAFYGAAGFIVVAESAAPPFLAARVRDYRARGLDVLLMHRPADDRSHDGAGFGAPSPGSPSVAPGPPPGPGDRSAR